MAYGGNPGTGTAAQRRDAVYLRVGDTITTPVTAQLLTDAEVDFFLSQSGNAILPAAINAARAIAANFMRQARVAHGPSSVDPTKRADDYFKLVEQLEAEIGLSADADAGGISISDNEILETDTDWPLPSFEIGQDDNPPTVIDETREVC